MASSRIGKSGNFDASARRSAERCRCCHSGVRCPGRRRGSRSARAAASRNTLANIAVCGTACDHRLLRSRRDRTGGPRRGSGRRPPGRRTTMPSSLQSTCAPGPNRSSIRASIAIAHGACTREPNGESTHIRQSPISSRNRSTTTVRSSGTGAGRLHLLLEVGDEVPRRQLVQADVATESLEGGVAPRASERPRERADRAAELDRAARLVAVPERHPPLLAGRGRDDHPVARDVLDAPRRGAEDDHVAAPALVDHLLVELADARPRRRGRRRTGRDRGWCRRT